MNSRAFEKSLRSCRSALQNARASQKPTRAFSSNAIRRRKEELPTFAETDIHELNSLFETVRSRIFVPAYVRTAQRKLIFQSRNHAILRAEPFTIDIGSETVQLEPLDRTKDIPDSWKSLFRAMKLMGSNPSNWPNLIPLLRGMKTAGRNWKTWQLEKIVQMAGENGMANVIVDAIREAPRTGLFLSDLRVVREVMWACRAKVALHGWEEVATEKALRYAEQTASWLQDEDRVGKGQELRVLQLQPDVIGVLLEIATIRAAKHLDGVDEGGKVESYAKRLIPNLNLKTHFSDQLAGKYAASADYELLRWVPVLSGLTRARELLGERMPEAELVGNALNDLRTRVEDAGDLVTNSGDPHLDRRRGLKWLEEFRSSRN